jgi:hypothetical protein
MLREVRNDAWLSTKKKRLERRAHACWLHFLRRPNWPANLSRLIDRVREGGVERIDLVTRAAHELVSTWNGWLCRAGTNKLIMVGSNPVNLIMHQLTFIEVLGPCNQIEHAIGNEGVRRSEVTYGPSLDFFSQHHRPYGIAGAGGYLSTELASRHPI